MAPPPRSTQRRRRGRAVGVASLSLAVAATAATAQLCAYTGEPAEGFYTLVASTANPASEAVAVETYCTSAEPVVVQSDGGFAVGPYRIERVLSVPSDAKAISTVGNGLSRGADFSKATMATTLIMSGIPSDPRKLMLPPSLKSIDMGNEPNAQLASLDGVVFPASLSSITIRNGKMKTLRNVQFPASLTKLEILNTPLTTIEFQLPTALTALDLDGVAIGSIDQWQPPRRLESFKLYNAGTIGISGVRWPATLRTLDLSRTTVSVFEIRESDVAVIEKLGSFRMTSTQAACRSPATPSTVASVKLCVLSDADFDTLYGPGDATSPSPESTKTPKSPANANGVNGDASGGLITSSESSKEGGGDQGSSGSTTSGSSTGETTGSRDRVQRNSSGSTAYDPAEATSEGSMTGDNGESSSATSRRQGRAGDTPENASAGSESTSGSTIGPLTIALISVLSLVVCLVLYRVVFARKKRHEANDAQDSTSNGKYTRSDTPTTTSGQVSTHERTVAGSVEESLSIDFRDDKDLVRCRIEDVEIGKRIARGGYGIVYRGSYQGRVVAIKQMLPDMWRNDSMTAAFVDEIRMCARLHHPKIVEFIGVSWTGVRDLSAVSEFMAGGDLHTVLHKHPEPTGREWTTSWTSSNLRNKTLIATDVAEAIVYLHSFDAPIIHRDLKTKNVLLDLVGNAKLSDFGISRTVSVDETMTSEVGTAAWIAPEVLRGERYSEKADIFSLGVLLVEMDRCSHPYAKDPVLLMSSMTRGREMGSTRVAYKNTQIAVMVSTGKLKPTPTLACPLNVAALIARCLIFETAERPTAIEVLHELRRIREHARMMDDAAT